MHETWELTPDGNRSAIGCDTNRNPAFPAHTLIPTSRLSSEDNSRFEPGNYFNCFFPTGKPNPQNVTPIPSFLQPCLQRTLLIPGCVSALGVKRRNSDAEISARSRSKGQALAMSMGHCCCCHHDHRPSTGGAAGPAPT